MEKPPVFTESKEQSPFDISGYLEKPEEEKDPMAIMQRLAEEGATQEQYEQLIPEVEARTLQKMSLLETHQLLMRGDCVSGEAIRNPKEHLETTTGAITNLVVSFADGNEKRRAMQQLQMDIIERARIAEHYLEKNEDPDADVQPVLIYSLTNRPKKATPWQLLKDAKGHLKYSYGGSDDMGRYYEHPKVITLPPKIFSVMKAHEDPRETHGPFRYFSQTEASSLEDFGISENFVKAARVPEGRFSWSHDTRSAYLGIPETQLATLLCLEKMLSEK